MSNIVVLGCGMVGSAMALDLCSEHNVSVIDIDAENLKRVAGNNTIKPYQKDISKLSDIESVISASDIVVNAVPGFMGYETAKNIIGMKKNLVDISFFPEDSLTLNTLCEDNGVTAIFDIGVAPGMSNLILGFYNERMQVSDFVFYVGGLPKERHLPWQYKAPFSPVDVIEEYTRPARFMEDGKIVVRKALSDSEFLDFDHVGTLEAFNTDGLRTLLQTMPIPNMKEKTLRYPGYIDLIKVLKESGFFSEKEIIVKGNPITPLDFTSKILFDNWKLESDEKEFTVMRIIIRGNENNRNTEYRYDLYDEFDESTQISSMARTTGYTATATVNMLLSGLYTKAGAFAPEHLGADQKCFDFIMGYLEKRNINYIKTQRLLD